jgi:hypothetical protein
MDNIVFNLSDNSHYTMVRNIANNYLLEKKTIQDLWEISQESPLFESLAAFLAISKIKIQKHGKRKLRIAILMNLIHEHNRLRPSSPKNVNGENSLYNKLSQLKWILEDTEIEYQLIYVSGSCPWGSEKILEDEIDKCNSSNVTLLRIEDSAMNSLFIKNQKGGEIIFGIRSILQLPGYPDTGSFDCMLFTDADMTFDLGQLGFLIDGFYSGEDVIIGNRMDPRSILEKNMTRAGRGVLMYRHLQRKLTPGFFIDMNLSDTQCPWKFLPVSVLKEIAMELDSMDWSIDTDILSSVLSHGFRIHTIPVTAIDSELESHGKAIGHFRRNKTIIEGVLHQAHKYELSYDKDIEQLVNTYLKTEDDYRALLESDLPVELSSLQNLDWGKSPMITLPLVEMWLQGLHTH